MGYESPILAIERGIVKIQHDDFVPSTATKQTVQDEEEAESSTQWVRIEESLLGVTPSRDVPELYEIFDISSSHMADLEEGIQIYVF